MEAVRRFLVKENDKGELNLNSLTLLGSGMGANVAAYWQRPTGRHLDLPLVNRDKM